MARPPKPDPDALLFAAVSSFHRAFGEMLEPVLSGVRITNGEFFFLFFLSQTQRPTVGELAEKLGVRMPFITHLVNELEGKHLVRRERSTSDRRVVRLVLTSAGLRLVGRIQARMLQIFRAASGLIPAARKLNAARVLNEISGGAMWGTRGLSTSRKGSAGSAKLSDGDGGKRSGAR